VSYPKYHEQPRPRPATGRTPAVVYVLLITMPAVVAIAALRPR
jgi:protein TonB